MKTEKRDQVLSMKVTKKVIEKINYITRSKNISRPDLFTSYVFAQNGNEQQREILDSIAWESKIIQDEIKKTRIDQEDIYLFQKAKQINLDNENKKDISLYKKGDMIITKSNILVVIREVNHQKKEFTITSLPITDTPVYQTINLQESFQNIISLFRF